MSRTWILSGCLGVLLLGCVGKVSTARGPGGGGLSSIDDDGGAGDADGEHDGSGTDGDGVSDGDGVGDPDGDGNMPPLTPQRPPPPVVADCSGLAAPGVFEEITPPEVRSGIGVVREGGGTFAIAADPVNQGTLYAGTLFSKVWKSTDCGATWQHISTGRNGAQVDSGMNWTFAVDPIEPQVVYTNSGYGTNYLYKSSNGGVDWDVVWPPASQPELSQAFQYQFANVVVIDPTNHRHLLLTFHESCLPPHPSTCIAESFDAGSTWRLVEGEQSWNGNEGQVIFFMDNSSTWLWGSQFNGFYRTADSGQSWEVIPQMTTTHLQGSQLERTDDGTYYMAGGDGVWRSPDGLPSTWRLVPNTGPINGGLVSSGANLYMSTCYFANSCNPRYLRSSASDGQNWTAMNSPQLSQGGTFAYDPGHKLLFSSNLRGGLWRVVVE